MSTRRTPVVALLGAALAAVMLAGCAVGPGDAGALPSDTPTPGGSVTTPLEPTPGQPSRVPTSLPPPGQTTLTGTVEMSEVEGGCLILRSGPTTYELMGGDQQVLRPGNEVVVEGKVNTGVVTICQVGPVFEVTSARLA